MTLIHSQNSNFGRCDRHHTWFNSDDCFLLFNDRRLLLLNEYLDNIINVSILPCEQLADLNIIFEAHVFHLLELLLV